MHNLTSVDSRVAATQVLAVACALLLAAATAHASAIKKLDLDKERLPTTIEIRGNVVDGARWADELGENLLVLTQTGAFPSEKKESDDERDAELYGYHFVRKAGEWTRLWKIQDFERNCPFDLYVGFLPGSVAVTDLDSDGIAETSFLYKLSCRSDVSPSRLKLIMHEGEAKYAVRGHTVFPKTWKMVAPEDMKPDRAFAGAPASFKEYAIKRWKEVVVEESFDQF